MTIDSRHIPKAPTPEPISILDRVSILETMTTDDSSNSDSEIESHSSVRLYPTKPRNLVQRRATITGASPTAKHCINIEQLWRELKEEHSTTFQLRDRAASCANGLDNVQALATGNLNRPQTCLGIEQRLNNKVSVRGIRDIKSVQFQDSSSILLGEQYAHNNKTQLLTCTGSEKKRKNICESSELFF